MLQLILPVVDGEGVVVSAQSMDEGLNRGLLEVAEVGGGLPRLLTHGLHSRVSQTECNSTYICNEPFLSQVSLPN